MAVLPELAQHMQHYTTPLLKSMGESLAVGVFEETHKAINEAIDEVRRGGMSWALGEWSQV